MVAAAEAIQAYTKGGKRRFVANPMAQDAVMRRFEVMGEAARRTSQAFRDGHPQVPWRSIMAFRNVLIHGYDAVELDKVWDAVGLTVNQVLPALRRVASGAG